MADNPFPRQIPKGDNGVNYYTTARKILVLPSVQERLDTIAQKIQKRAGEGHGIKKDRTRDRVRVQVFTASDSAKIAEASDKTLTKAFAAERTTPRRPTL